MDVQVGSQDHRQNEFYTYRYSTRFQKGELVEIRTGLDLEVARFQARKSFPDVLNEYWWLKPSDVPALKDIPLKISDIYYYHGGVPVLVLLTANGSMTRKTQVFVRKKDETRSKLDDRVDEEIEKMNAQELAGLLLDHNFLIRLKVFSVLSTKYADFIPKNIEAQIAQRILSGNYEDIATFGEEAVDQLIERFFVTSHPKETEKILESIIQIGEVALPRLEDMSEYLSVMASPFYAKRINWTISQISKTLKKKTGR
ncbi:MAG TPA: hypothetical protein PLE67_00165 [Tenuifilaceae bacterium]|nr:hypothetical protein [Tenuifilaceae bacterium]HPE18092.1 hypothetical protein [Tenuifilaceae bacterium]HPQ34079.1 hypothetical protein [Tenuifilaceae bacterium]HRX68026.1 hypothetical protein [Tenuifilaceae bacterium]